ncbi:hypothetical protein BD309DRAFT_872801 [Dichomitus squalens]|uniref:Uncharacterized protein n=2 Tax=Dichomitus squalens TaxID=114155 RepID=A0A4Q9NF10_9APHY|nr:uncharacterized protein DICSQDRAFT_169247 [Dichomitus squalens LYAD-421 SS1]EJF62216.1 hypothetical protein DICSQDRAFT_169247 [Dichomitus squalens LYAD-421 SS1]TBU39198.1 hypothetical protein BD309DRAFT_872801 [Dichomitus squalens]TBU53538.1 hypothetical protein BD310DRAFT_981020 [Dichomitus squalens]
MPLKLSWSSAALRFINIVDPTLENDRASHEAEGPLSAPLAPPLENEVQSCRSGEEYGVYAEA